MSRLGGSLISRVWRVKKATYFDTVFGKGSKGRFGEAFLTDVVDLGSQVGFQRGSVLKAKGSFF